MITDQSGNPNAPNFSAGTGSLRVDGAGTVDLAPVDQNGNAVANTFTGGITVESGTLAVASDAALGTGGTLALDAGTTFDLTGAGTISHAITIAGDPTFEVDSGTSSVSSTITDATGGAPAGEVEKTGAGTLVLSGANTYSGGTALAGGTLDLDAATTLAVNGTTILSGAAGTGAIAFGTGAHATLKIEAVAFKTTGTTSRFANTISGFAIGDALDLTNLAASGATVRRQRHDPHGDERHGE